MGTSIIKSREKYPIIRHDIKDLFAKPISQYKNHKTEEVLEIYKNTTNEQEKNEALQHLFYKFNKFIIQVATKYATTAPHMGEFDDYMLIAYQGFIYCLDKFDMTKGNKLYTYIRTSLPSYIAAYIDDNSIIKCNSNCRTIRAYLRGKYDNDPVKKAAFEKKYKLFTEKDKEDFYKKHILLLNHMYSYENLYAIEEENINTSTSNLDSQVNHKLILETIFNDEKTEKEYIDLMIDVSNVIKDLNPIQKSIFVLYYLEGLNKTEISEKLNISIYIINNHLQIIEKCLHKLKMYYKRNNITI